MLDVGPSSLTFLILAIGGVAHPSLPPRTGKKEQCCQIKCYMSCTKKKTCLSETQGILSLLNLATLLWLHETPVKMSHPGSLYGKAP